MKLRHPETKYDLSNEEAIIKKASACWNVDYHKLPIQYKLDYALTAKSYCNKIKAFCEVKKRNNNILDYGSYIISLAKIQAGRELAKITNTTSILIVQWNDMLGYVDFNVDFDCIIGGRFDRNDWQDKEPLAEIHIKKFKKLNKSA
tara:strand:+ start:873 stop:1310 length:438 start_codon:yes stop_codon:yes gene_type:complete